MEIIVYDSRLAVNRTPSTRRTPEFQQAITPDGTPRAH
jgi:hypothetical protein